MENLLLRNRFGEDALKQWWNPKDFLQVEGEKAITERMTEEQIVQMVIQDVEQLKKEIEAIC